MTDALAYARGRVQPKDCYEGSAHARHGVTAGLVNTVSEQPAVPAVEHLAARLDANVRNCESAGIVAQPISGCGLLNHSRWMTFARAVARTLRRLRSEQAKSGEQDA